MWIRRIRLIYYFATMKRIMALDVGSRRIGIALSDPLKITASPSALYERKTLEEDVEFLLEFAAEHQVDEIIVGHPVYLSGEESRVLECIKPIFESLRQGADLKVNWCEERLSSREAEKVLLGKGYSPREVRKNRDSFAAALILTWYLEEGGRKD